VHLGSSSVAAGAAVVTLWKVTVFEIDKQLSEQHQHSLAVLAVPVTRQYQQQQWIFETCTFLPYAAIPLACTCTASCFLLAHDACLCCCVLQDVPRCVLQLVAVGCVFIAIKQLEVGSRFTLRSCRCQASISWAELLQQLLCVHLLALVPDQQASTSAVQL
jgi:hypothetical protein